MFYYSVDGHICCSPNGELPYEKIACPTRADALFYLMDRSAQNSRASFSPTCAGQLLAESENASALNSTALPQDETDAFLAECIAADKVRAINLNHPRFTELFTPAAPKHKARINILALGDVGGTMLTGLRLLGGDVVDSIGICDLSPAMSARWEIEANQINYPWNYDSLPPVEVVTPEQLFDCDLFVFVASKGIPPVGSGIKDVRMAQFETNRKIAEHYARMAREAHFKGLWCQVSDPIDPLAKSAYLASNTNENGVFDGQGLLPEQIQGFGLGVMNARAAYYAKKDEARFGQFLTEGRAFGPHGKELVIADSILHYNDALSCELTEKVVTANLAVRELGFKPYVAPAMSSGAISLLLTLRGEWHYGSVFLGGAFMGCKTRMTAMGQQTECLPLPDALYARIQAAEAALHAIV